MVYIKAYVEVDLGIVVAVASVVFFVLEYNISEFCFSIAI